MLVRLTKPHEHAGKANPAGAEIELPEADARYLISIDAAASITPPSQPFPIEGEGVKAKTSSKPKSQSQSQETKS
ncbi:MAG: hypothetical protein JXK51_06635 [Halothiobacillaceae bacterium]|nr:hypothetical protein [Halothiobacillaceae bacterium]